MILESLEVVIPEPLVMRDPVPHRAESLGDETIVPLSAMPLFRHETGIQQDAKVLRDGRPADLEMSRNRVDGAVGVEEQIEHPATRGMADCSKDILLTIENHNHGAIIRKQTLTRQVQSGPCRLGRSGELIGGMIVSGNGANDRQGLRAGHSIPHAVELRQFLCDVCVQGRSFAPALPRKGGAGHGVAGHAGPVTGAAKSRPFCVRCLSKKNKCRERGGRREKSETWACALSFILLGVLCVLYVSEEQTRRTWRPQKAALG